jgi:acyl carrier protein
MTNLRDEIIAIITETSYPNKPNLSDDKNTLVESGMDSLDWASSLMAIEDKYDIKFSAEEFDSISTLGAIVEYVQKRADN